MSFSSRVKNELAHIQPSKKCCRLAELSAILRLDGTFHIQGEGSYAFHTKTENAAVARKTYKFLTSSFSVEAGILASKSERLKKNNEYLIYIPAQATLDQLLNETGILDDRMRLRYGIPTRLVRKKCCALAYLRGVFLAVGAVGDPRKEYHFELVIDGEELARGLVDLMNRLELRARMSSRKKNFAVYLKESDQIVKFLALVGAHDTLLKWEDIRIVKDVRNQVNRLVNCDTANLKKSVEAAQAQIEDIMVIERSWGLSGLPGPLRQVAEARLRFPEASIRELGELCIPALSKSAVYHRLRKLSEIALLAEQAG
jgi:DNA-binding protein WhiA